MIRAGWPSVACKSGPPVEQDDCKIIVVSHRVDLTETPDHSA